MDVTVTAQAITQTAQVVSETVLNASPSQLLDMVVAAAGGGLVVEAALAKFAMAKIPTAAKPYVPAVIAIGGGTLAAMKGGVPWQTALALGLGAYVTSQIKNDVAPTAVPSVQQNAPSASTSTPTKP